MTIKELYNSGISDKFQFSTCSTLKEININNKEFILKAVIDDFTDIPIKVLLIDVSNEITYSVSWDDWLLNNINAFPVIQSLCEVKELELQNKLFITKDNNILFLVNLNGDTYGIKNYDDNLHKMNGFLGKSIKLKTKRKWTKKDLKMLFGPYYSEDLTILDFKELVNEKLNNKNK